ncbi:DUF222 domain-containing protein [Actinomycetospora sp. CA-053990]|uniref:HNH endonuclease signature motif containing protein n=1 Tax=Actinomycetospora sp. CA-053990 TaxID=3239891 RepID=UPI003D949C82
MSERGVGTAERAALDRLRARMVALRCEQYRLLEDVAELERLGVAVSTGNRTTERLLQDSLRIDLKDARRLVGESEDLTPQLSLRGEPLPVRMPTTARVMAEGLVDDDHVEIIRKAMARLAKAENVDPWDVVDAERILADEATRLPPRALDKVAKRLLDHLDPDGAAPEEGADRWDELYVTRRRDGSLVIKGRFRDPVDAELIWEVFDTLATPTGPDDARDRPSRNASALKDLVEDAAGPGGLAAEARREGATEPDTEPDTEPGADPEADGRSPADDVQPALIPEPRRPEAPAPTREAPRSPGRPLLTITMDLRWLQLAVGHGTLDFGALSDPATIRRWACDAEIVPMVLGAKSEPLDIGRRSRLIPDAMRRALTFRDGGCAFPGCTRRPRRCHAHHVEHWAADEGPTCLENLTLLCRHHHQVIHHGHWTVQMIDGLPWFTPPRWVDPERRPRPGGQRRLLAR